jgi:hypothetical protein
MESSLVNAVWPMAGCLPWMNFLNSIEAASRVYAPPWSVKSSQLVVPMEPLSYRFELWLSPQRILVRAVSSKTDNASVHAAEVPSTDTYGASQGPSVPVFISTLKPT